MKYIPIIKQYLKEQNANIQVFELFRAWIKKAGLSDSFVIQDERKILEEFDSSLENAFRCLLDNNIVVSSTVYNQLKGKWYVFGFIESNLGLKWTHLYKLPFDEEYLRYKSIKEMSRVIEFDMKNAIKFNQAMINHMKSIHTNINFDFHDFDYIRDTVKYFDEGFKYFIANYKSIDIPRDIVEQELEKINFYKLLKAIFSNKELK